MCSMHRPQIEETGNRLWLDDVRPMPARFTHLAKTSWEAIDLLKTVQFEEVSLDHDLGVGIPDGHEVAKLIEEGAFNGTLKPMRMFCHSQNAPGRERIRSTLHNAWKHWQARLEDEA